MGKLKDGLARMSAEKQSYTLETLPSSLAERSKGQRLHQLLTDFDFIEAKLELLGVQALVDDYDLARNSQVLLSQEQSQSLRLIQGAIRKSAHVLEKNKTQLAGHLWGRLLPYERTQIIDESKYFWEYLPLMPRFLPRKPIKKVTEKITPPYDIQALLEQAKQSRDCPCLWPLKPNLERANEGALRTLAGHSFWVNAVAIAPDGKTAISASYDQTLKIWDTETGRELKTLTGHSKSVNAVDLAPDGKTAISASYDQTLKIWDTETGSELKTLTGHSNWVNAVDLAPDGKTAISASRDHTLKIWDIETGRELKTLTGHSNSVTAVAIAPDGKIAISASDDRTLKIWELLSGKEVVSFSGDGAFSGCAFAPDGVTVVAGDASGRVHFLRLEGVSDRP